MIDKEEIRQERERLEAKSVGPLGISIMMGVGPGAIPIIKVKQTPETKKVFDAHAIRDDYEVGSQWGLLKQSDELTAEYLTLFLILDWPELDAEFVCLFPVSEWRSSLEALSTCQMFGVAEEGPINIERLLIADGSYTDIVDAVLAATRNG